MSESDNVRRPESDNIVIKKQIISKKWNLKKKENLKNMNSQKEKKNTENKFFQNLKISELNQCQCQTISGSS